MSRTLLLITCVTVLLGSFLRADDKPKGNPQAGVSVPGGDQAKVMAEFQQKLLQQFDLNKDGQLSEQEQMMAQEALRRQGWGALGAASGLPGMNQFTKNFDLNGDGQISPQEMMAAQAAYKRSRENGHGPGYGFGGAGGAGGVGGGGVGGAGGAGGGGGLGGGPADNGGGKLSGLAKRFDKDGDGKLNDEEKAALQADAKAKKKGKSEPKEKPAKKPAEKK